MADESAEFSMSKLSLHSNDSGSGSQNEDWDRSLNLDDHEEGGAPRATTTPRNSVVFPKDGINGHEDVEATPGKGSLSRATGKGKPRLKRSLTELMRVQKGGEGASLTSEEASELAHVLGEWINAGSSPYEGEDDFFARSQDDLCLPTRKSPNPDARRRTASSSSRHSKSGDSKT